MKLCSKILIIGLCLIIAVIFADTLQAKIFNNRPLLSIKDDNKGVYYLDKGIFVDHYSCILDENKNYTAFKWEKYTCPMSEEITLNKYLKEIEGTKIEFTLPNNWNYKELTINENDNYKYALKIYKSNEENSAILYYLKNEFGVCGTLRTDETINLNNGNNATIGYYSENWSDISFGSSNPYVAIINKGLIEEESKEFLEIVKMINIT